MEDLWNKKTTSKARQQLRGLSSLSRKIARLKSKEGKKLLKCKENDVNNAN